MDLKRYKTLVLDCDGVVLDSNQLKTRAYFNTAKSYGASDAQAQALVDHHVQYGGISRYPKYAFFLREILHQPVTDAAMITLLDRFASEIHQGLLSCEMAPGLVELHKATPDACWMLVSGGDQSELRKLFAERQIDYMFDAGIFGSPDNKDEILAREKTTGNLAMPALFFGDSKYDHQSSTRAGLDFIFVSNWTDMVGWQDYCAQNKILLINQLSECLH